MAHVYVKPVEGRMPRHETTHRQLPPEGDWWPDSPYTRRRLRDGDVVLATEPNAAAMAVDQAAQAAGDQPIVGASTVSSSARGAKKSAGRKE